MDIAIVLLLALVAFGVLIFAAVTRRAVLAAISGVAFLFFGIVWAGETFGFLNV